MQTMTKAVTALLLAGLCSSAYAEWAQGQVRRIDQTTQKLTIKHGEIKSIDMPPMTMVFTAREPGILDGIQVNDTIEFQAEIEGTKYYVTKIRKKGP
jgi:Cu(I)/Ag(I) efflux system protein CusF